MRKRRSDLSNYWINRAESLKDSAVILYGSDPHDLRDPCYLLAGLSIEVLVKAIIVKINQKFDDKKYRHHKINDLLVAAKILVNDDQRAMVGALEEAIYWITKYPDPINDQEYAKKMRAMEKKVEGVGPFVPVTTDEKRWPSFENYKILWSDLYVAYLDTPTENAGEFGYKLKGLHR